MMDKNNFDKLKKVIYEILKKEKIFEGEWHYGKVNAVLSKELLEVFVDGSTIAQKIPCNPDIIFNIGDDVFVIFVNKNSKDKFVPNKKGIVQDGILTMGDRINNTSNLLLPQIDWLSPTLINGWSEYSNGTYNPSYMKDALGFVYIRGSILGNTTGTIAFTLPVGCRPESTLYYTLSSGNGLQPAYCSIDNTGAVKINGSYLSFVSLDNITPFAGF